MSLGTKHSEKIIDLAIGLNLIKSKGNVINSAVNKYYSETTMPVKLNQITSYVLRSIYSEENNSNGVKNG